MGIDQYFIEGDAFALERLQDKFVDWPEGVFWKRLCTQTVLIAHHDELEIGMLADEVQIAEHALGELQFLKGINLLVGRLFYQRTVTIDK
jgi:hypothetical protein